MNRIDQVIETWDETDPVTSSALAIRESLRRTSLSEIYGAQASPGPALQSEIRPLSELASPDNRDLLIVHLPLGTGAVESVLDPATPFALVFHDVPDVVGELPSHAVLTIVETECAAARLREMHVDRVVAVPPPFDPTRRRLSSTDAQTQRHLAAKFDEPILLCVADMTPSSRHDYLVEAMHVAATYLGSVAYLLLVGEPVAAEYQSAIREQIYGLNLAGVHLVGPVSPSELVAYYRAACAVVSAREDARFPTALLDAMAFDLPVLARATGGTPDGVDDAALLLSPVDGPDVCAEALLELLGNKSLRDELTARGRARLQSWTEFDAARRFADVVRGTL